MIKNVVNGPSLLIVPNLAVDVDFRRAHQLFEIVSQSDMKSFWSHFIKMGVVLFLQYHGQL